MSEIEYLATPYSHKDVSVMDFRAEVSDVICADLMNQGRLIYAPISSCHHIAKKYGLPRDWQFWQRLDKEFVKACKKLIIIKLEGWEISTGLNAELELAKEYGLEIEYIDPEPYIKKIKGELNWKRKRKSITFI